MSENGIKVKKVSRGERDGFTLLEVLISLLLLYMIAGLMVNAMGIGLRGIAFSTRQTLACAYGTSLLEEMKAHPERYVVRGGASSFAGDDGCFAAEPPAGMQAQINLEPLPAIPAVYRVNICMSGEQEGEAWQDYLVGYVRLPPETL